MFDQQKSVTIVLIVPFSLFFQSMVTLTQVETKIKAKLPDAEVIVNDLKGGGDHLEAIVVSSAFIGQSSVKQHQLVYGALKEEMNSGAIHALALKTYTPQAWAEAGQTVSS